MADTGLITRAYMLDDVSIRADGTGRTVVAYAALFDTEAEIQDQDGHYLESLARSSFDKTVAERAGQIGCFYNHGKTLYGTPSERFSIPLGVPKEIRPDAKGLMTATAYSRSTLADELLDLIKDGAPMGQSFSGRFMPGRSQRTRGASGALDTIVRQEIALREYGPTPTPAYKETLGLGVRSDSEVAELADALSGLGEQARRSLIASLSEALRLDLLHLLGTFRTGATPVGDAAQLAADAALLGTSATNDTPGTSAHLSGPTQEQRRRRAHALDLVPLVPKGTP
jgi:HK97 family phage prohead protease